MVTLNINLLEEGKPTPTKSNIMTDGETPGEEEENERMDKIEGVKCFTMYIGSEEISESPTERMGDIQRRYKPEFIS